jgi:hypothetical protein
MAVRAILKFTHAYNATEDTSINVQNGEVTVEYSYWHQQAFPYVGKVFGQRASENPLNSDRGHVDGRAGYFVEYAGNYTLPQQRCTISSDPNDATYGCPANSTVP